MQLYPLPESVAAQSGYTHRLNILYTDLNDTAGLTKTLDGFAPGVAGWWAMDGLIYTKVAAGSAAITSLTITNGDSGSGTRFHAASANIYAATAGTITKPSFTQAALQGTYIQKLLFTVVTANLSTLTAGEWDILCKWQNPAIFCR